MKYKILEINKKNNCITVLITLTSMKKTLLLIVGLLLTSTLMAGPVGKEEAKEKALAFLKEEVGTKSARAPRHVQDVVLAQSNDAYYVFNVKNDVGFVIVSGSDLTPSIIGYADEGSFDANNIPSNMKAWLQGYADQIAYLEKSGNSASSAEAMGQRRTSSVKVSIAPMLPTAWNQDAPYNYLCPDFFTYGKSVTGCVATALAQVLYYHYQSEGLPTGTKKEIPAYECATSWGGLGKVSVAACPASTFDWANMQATYTGSEETTDVKALAVAKLMQYCGAAVNMDYSNSANGGSAASLGDIPQALNDYFGFDKNVLYRDRLHYTTIEWEELIYQELVAGRPVLYGGQSSGGGHAFVCDGYDADGYFHINWGWGGLGNSYFLLSVLNPNEKGVGGGSTRDGYSMSQNVVLGIQEPTGKTIEDGTLALSVLNLAYTGSAEVSKSSTFQVSYTYSYRNDLSYKYDFYYGLGIYDDSDNLVSAQGFSGSTDDWRPGVTVSGSATMYLSTEGLTVGETYKIKPVCRLKGSETWQKCLFADNHYIQAVVSASKIGLSSVSPTISLVASDVTPTTCVKGELTTITATITNNGADYSGNLYLLLNGSSDPVAGNGISVEAGKKTTASFAFIYSGDAPDVKTMKITTDKEGTNVIWSGNLDVQSGVTGTDTPELTFTTELNLDDSNQYILGNKLIAKVTATNATSSNYVGKVILMCYKWTGGSGSGSGYTNDLIVPANSSVDVDYVYDVEMEGKYSVQLQYMHNGGYEQTTPSTVYTSYYAKPAVTSIAPDGTETLALATASYVVPADASVVDLRDQSVVTSITKNSNPNTIYLLDESAATPSGITDNVVKGATAANIVLTDDGTHGFYTPVDFTATKISYTRTFTNGATAAGGGWNTIVLPFDVATVSVGGTAIDWFKSTTDSGKNFWLYAFANDEEGTVNFTYADAIEADKPYIINVPSDAWGEAFNLVGKAIVFSGTDAAISSDPKSTLSGNYYLMNGTRQTEAVTDAYVMNAEGKKFVKTTGSVAPFQAYFSDSSRKSTLSSLAIGFDTSEGGSTNILVPAEHVSTNAAVYNLQGVKMGTANQQNKLPKGIYIINGKKIIKK